MKKVTFASILIGIVAFANAQTRITADFSKWEEYPLVKKIGVYETPLTNENWLQRDLPKLAELQSRAYRFEFAWGKESTLYGTSTTITGTKNKPVYNFAKADLMFDKVAQHTEAFVFAHGYTPNILQPNSGDLRWQRPPTDYNVWQEVNKNVAAHWKEKGYSNRYIEVWNEPDLPGGFFSGTLDDYLQVYKYCAKGANEGDADAKIGGPAIAYMTNWHSALTNFAKNEKLPLNFLSGHAYGESYTWELDAMRSALNDYGDKQAEMLLTEYSPYESKDYAANGPVERAEAAMTFFNALPTMLEYTDLTYVTWAQFIDPEAFGSGKAYSDWDKLGLIDGNYGYRKALFNAFKLYGEMPVDRNKISGSSAIPGMASSDDSHVAAVLWNTSTSEKSIKLTLRNIPFEKGTLYVYHIDEKENSWYETGLDQLTADRIEVIDIDGNVEVSDVLRSKGVFFVKIDAENAEPVCPKNNFAKLIKTNQWFTSRTNTASYAQFDSKTWTAHLSTNSQQYGWAIVSAEAEDLPESFSVITKQSGKFTAKNVNSAFDVRFDFMDNNGKYVKAVVFHNGLYNTERTNVIPWGTKKEADEIVQVDDFSKFVVDLSQYKPQNASGRVLITFELASTGVNTKANIQLKRSDETSLSAVSCENISTTSATLSSQILGSNTNITERGFIIKAGKDPIDGYEKKVVYTPLDGEIMTSRFAQKVTGLTTNKSYHVRSYVNTENGETIYSPEYSFTTLTSRASVSSFKPEVDTEKLSVVLSGKISSTGGSQLFHAGIVWKEGTEGDFKPSDNYVDLTSKAAAGAKYQYTLNGLKADTDYSYCAYAVTQGGIAYGKTFTFTTKTVDAISDIVIEDARTSSAIYDINGRKISDTHKGLQIINGKKYFIK